MASDGGKGSGRRPLQIPKEQFESNWDKIFGKKDADKKTPTELLQDVYEQVEQLEKKNG